jgi:competence protein ComEA
MPDFIKQNWRPFLFGLAVGLLSVPLILLLNRPPVGEPIALLPPPPTVTPLLLRIHVVGAVKNPGVYYLSQTSIVQDGLDAAGGLLPDADPTGLNLASLLTDGQQLSVPTQPTRVPTVPSTPTVGPGTPTLTPEPATPIPTAASAPAAAAQPAAGNLININTAAQAELESLPRIGPAIAQRIIDYRTANGPFTTIEQIMNVKGIGPATFEQIKNFIAVK